MLSRVLKTIGKLHDNPRPRGCRKIGPYDWRVRVGDYRILYEVSDKEAEVVIYRIRHRSEVYR